MMRDQVAAVFVLSAALFISTPGFIFAQVTATPLDQFNGIPADWLAEYTAEVDAQVERFGTAYSLSPEAQANLRQTLASRLAEQYQFESKSFLAVQAQLDDAIAKGMDLEADTPENKAIMDQFLKIPEISPLNDLVIAKELEAGLDPEVAEQGRTRLVDLIVRRDQIAVAKDDDFELQSGHNGSLTDARLSADASITAAGNPLPRGEKLIQVSPDAVNKVGGDTVPSKPVEPNPSATPIATDNAAMMATGALASRTESKPDINEVKAAADALLADPTKTMADAKNAAPNGRSAKARAAVKPVSNDRVGSAPKPAVNPAPVESKRISDQGAAPSRAVPTANEAVRLQAAPPLDDWDKYVDTTCKKFGFSDAQVIKAQSILKDLRNRAAAYRSSRNEDFAAAERLVDAKAKADRKKELFAPIDAFFEELKQRLDNLATLEQRAKATAPLPGKK